MDANDLITDLISSFGSSFTLEAVETYRKYIDDKPSDQIQGYRYKCKCNDMRRMTITVKIAGKALMNSEDAGTPVVFTGLDVYFYSLKNETRSRYSLSATSIAPVTTTSDKKTQT